MKKIDLLGHLNGNKYIYYLLIIPLSILSISCSINKNIIDYTDVESIKYWYINKYIETFIPITNCADIVYDTLINKNTIINDRIVIKQYIEAINRLKLTKRHISYDLRVASAIKFKDSKRENIGICISLFNGVIIKDDVVMKGGEDIVKLLDEILYNHLTEKDWLPEIMRNENN
jgi:hypothetical protein